MAGAVTVTSELAASSSSYGHGMTTVNFTKETPEPYVRPFSDTAIIVSASFIIPMSVFGIFANVVTIIVICRSRLLRSIFNLFILSLCVSDLLSAIISPLFLYRRTWGFDAWLLPNFFCKFYWATDMLTSFSTSHHILVYSGLRLLSIAKPHMFKKITRKYAVIIIVAIWTICFGTGFVVYWIWFSSGKRNRNDPNDLTSKWPACTIMPIWYQAFLLYVYVGYAVHVYIPMAGIILFSACTCGVILRLRQERKQRAAKSKRAPGTTVDPTSRKEKKAMVQLAMIVGSYLAGYVPFGVYFIMSMTMRAVTLKEKQADWTFGVAQYICLRLTECLNPIFYNLASEKMRKETFAFLRMCKTCGTGEAMRNGRGENPSRIAVTETSGM